MHWLCRTTLEEAARVVQDAGLIGSPSPISAALERKLAFLRNDSATLAAMLPGMTASFRPSTLQSLIRGRAHETDYLNGEVVRVAAEHGTRAPINELLTHTMHDRAGRPSMSASTLRRAAEQYAGPADGLPR
jgi:2-dehydropantoate 2-reductase